MRKHWHTVTQPSAASKPVEIASSSLNGHFQVKRRGHFRRFAEAVELGSSTLNRNNLRADMYHDLFEAITSLAMLPEGDPMRINLQVCTAALDIVGVLKENFDVPPPKIFPHEDETLVLKWDERDKVRMLWIEDDDEVDLIDRRLGESTSQVVSANAGADGTLGLLFEHLGKPILSGSVSATPITAGDDA